MAPSGSERNSIKRQKIIGSVVLFCFTFVFAVSALGTPQGARAQLVVSAPALETIEVQREVRLGFGQAIIASATVGLINAITLFGQQIAYDLAVGLASGCRGQNACAFRDSFGTYLTSKLYAAAGEFIGTLAEPWAELGFDLCNPRLPDIGLAIQLGLISEIQPPTPRCDFVGTINNWQNLVREVQDPNALLRHVSLGFDTKQTDFGQAFLAHEQFRIKIARDEKAAEKEREEGQGIRPQISPISGNITTPSVVIRKNFENITEQGENQTPEVGAIVGATLGSGQVWAAVGTTVLATFTNTLISRMLRLALQGIFGPGAPFQPPDLRSLVGGGTFRDPTQEGTAGLSSSAIGLISAAGAIRTPQGTFEYLTELNACPANPRVASQFNCTIDDKFMLALQGGPDGQPFTVAQAMDPRNGLLDGAKPFGFINPEEGIEPTVAEGYPYSSMKKLRLLRVIPVGWEFAALKIRGSGQTFTLREVVDGWNKTGPDGVCGKRPDGTIDDESPFCGLVDPNWILKAPAAKCNALVWGERVDLSGAGRQESCADLRHCVALDQDGSCRATGYCTREKNIWGLGGEHCGEQYASCDTFRKGGTGEGGARPQEVSLLENTVDFGVCNAANAGCTRYLTRQSRSTDGQWRWDLGVSGRLYLDQDAPACDSSAAGCTELIANVGSSINLINNGSFENDADSNGFPDGWVRIPSYNSYLRGVGDAYHGAGAMLIISSSDLSAAIPDYTIASSHGTTLGSTGTAPTDDKDDTGTGAAVQEGATGGIRGTGIGASTSDQETDEDEAAPPRAPSGIRAGDARSGSADGTSPAGTGGRTVRDTQGKGAATQKGTRVSPQQPAVTAYHSLRMNQTINVTPGKTYTVSLYAKLTPQTAYLPANPPRLQITFAGLNAAGVSMRGQPSDCDVVGDSTITKYIRASGSYERFSCRFALPFTAADDAQLRISTLWIEVPNNLTIAAGSGSILDRLIMPAHAQDSLAPGLMVDAIQLEEGFAPTDYHDGHAYVGAQQNVYYRLPPDYLGCTGESTDVPECGQYAGMCRPEEASCERYTPTLGGDPIPGIKTALDECPQSCVGYDTYIKQSSRFEPAFTRQELGEEGRGGLWPAGRAEEQMYRIIPSRTAKCTAPEAGCDEFTNLRTEAREYYTDLRACQTPVPGDDSKTYFTWEGSDERGYQLRSFNLKSSNIFYTTDSEDLAVEHNRDRAVPPCTNYAVSVERATQAITVTCEDREENQAVCNSADPDLSLEERADCRAFYDENGNIFHRRISQTILSTPECQVYRWTGFTTDRLPEVPALAGESAGALRSTLERLACEDSHGFWNTATLQCVYLGAPSASKSCRPQVSGCRGFKGDTAGNVRMLFNDTFPAGDDATVRWTRTDGGRAELSAEALRVGDKSLRVRGAAHDSTLSRALEGAGLEGGATYFVSMVVKGSINSSVDVALNGGNFGNLRLTPDWQFFDLGPVVLADVPAALTFKNVSGNAITYFIDEVRLRAVSDTLYLVKHTWDIPAACDELPAAVGGGPLRGAMLGCNSYTDRAGGASYLRSFSRLCRDESVGCSRLIDTRLTVSPFEETFNTGASAPDSEDDVTVDADRLRYVVINPEVRPDIVCKAEQKGCQALGVNAGETAAVYRRNDPTRYGSDLCAVEATGCAAWSRSNGSESYFKDPEVAGGGFCEWRENVRIGLGSFSGWFKKEKQRVSTSFLTPPTKSQCEGYGTWNQSIKKCIDAEGRRVDIFSGGYGIDNCDSCDQGGANPPCSVCQQKCTAGIGGQWQATSSTEGICVADTPCYGGVSPFTRFNFLEPIDDYLTGGSTFGIWRNADAGYAAGRRVGLCPKAESTCAEFVDPTDTAPEHPDGKPYYRKDNERLAVARSECRGLVSRKEGCVLFDNTENPAELWSAQATYDESERQGGAVVPPVTESGRRDRRCRGGTHNSKWCLPTTGGIVLADRNLDIGEAVCVEGGGICEPINNVNTLLKVARDRECAEWLQCTRAQLVWSPEDQKIKTACLGIGRCAKIPLPAASGGPTLQNCGGWIINPEPAVCVVGIDRTKACAPHPYAEDQITPSECIARGGICESQTLNSEIYRKRDRSFFGAEYAGYAIPNLYPLEKLREIDVSSPEFQGRNYYLAFTPPTPAEAAPILLQQPLCRGFPEVNSPFPKSGVVGERTGTINSPAFSNAPKCVTPFAEIDDGIRVCGCDYKKAEYGIGNVRYYPITRETTPGNLDNRDDGPIRTADLIVRGWQGYCLEQDTAPYSRIYNDPDRSACLTWWPVDQLAAAVDINNQFAQAGYQIPPVGGQYWCLASDEPVREIRFPEILGANGFRIRAGADDQGRRRSGGDEAVIRTFEVPLDYDIRKYDIKGVIVEIAGVAGEPWKASALNGNYYLEANNNDAVNDSRLLGDVDDGIHYLSWNTLAEVDEDWWWWASDDNCNDTGVGRGCGMSSTALRGLAEALRDYSVNIPEHIIHCTDIVGRDLPASAYDAAAVLLRFDDNQRLEYIRLAVCTNEHSAEVYFDVKVRLNPQCTDITKVDPLRSAPWTDRLWPSTTHVVENYGLDYNYNTGLPPFGSSSAQDDPPTSGNNNPWFLNWNRMEASDSIRDLSEFAGWPFSCAESIAPFSTLNNNHTSSYSLQASTCVGGADDGHTCVSERIPLGTSYNVESSACSSSASDGITAEFTPNRPGGVTGTCRTYGNARRLCELRGGTCGGGHSIHKCAVNSSIPNPGTGSRITAGPEEPLTDADPSNAARAEADIQQLFARSFKGFSWGPVNSDTKPHRGRYSQFDAVETGIGVVGAWDARMQGRLRTPEVSDVRIIAEGGQYIEGDIISRRGSLLTTLQFYGVADKDHMPIGRVSIDWDDDQQITRLDGLFQNHAPLCDGTNFGLQENVSCIGQPFQFETLYTCERGVGPNWVDTCPASGVRGGCCVFRPAVQIKDNWGYCNGICGGIDGAVNGSCIDSACNHPWNPDRPASQSPGGWTVFDGRIIVAP
ncbi:hypothetical protein HYW17_01610 [Candidatus Uhrbacteria bacterium]|nr:hypothetical protein [Candidatus Uhrbacteria bacterium]